MLFVYILETLDRRFLRHCSQSILMDRRCSLQQQKKLEIILFKDVETHIVVC